MQEEADSRIGHRKRLREKYLLSGPDAFMDYEILELLLSYAMARRDVKPMAKRLLEKYRSLDKIVDAEISDLASTPGIGEHSAILIKLVRALSVRYLSQQINEEDFMDTSEKFCDYARMRLGDASEESMLVFYLNAKNMLISTEIVSHGGADCVVVFPALVAKHALLQSAKSVVVCHNHPSGIVSPSREDNIVTKELRQTLEPLKINLLDHIIVSKYGYHSYRYADRERPPAFRMLRPLDKELNSLYGSGDR